MQGTECTIFGAIFAWDLAILHKRTPERVRVRRIRRGEFRRGSAVEQPLRGMSAVFGTDFFTSRSAGKCARRARRAVMRRFATRKCTCRVQRAASGSGKPLRGARRSINFLAALSALHHWDIPCPCNAREHPLGRGGKRKSDKNRHFPLSQTGFPSRSLSPQPSPPLPIFLVAAWELPCGCLRVAE